LDNNKILTIFSDHVTLVLATDFSKFTIKTLFIKKLFNMITNEWIKVDKNLITERNKDNEEDIKNKARLPITHFSSAFEADDIDLENNKLVNVRLRPGLNSAFDRPAQGGQYKGEKSPHYRGEPVFTVTISGEKSNPEIRGHQYYVDSDGNLIITSRKGGEPGPIRNHGVHVDTAKQYRDQNLSRKQVEKLNSISDDSPNQNTVSKASEATTRVALEKYIEERLNERGIKTDSSKIEGTKKANNIITSVFKKIFYETPDTMERNTGSFVGKVRQVFKDNHFNYNDIVNSDLLDKLYITYNDDDSEDGSGEELYSYIRYGIYGKKDRVLTNDGKYWTPEEVKKLVSTRPELEEDGYFKLFSGVSSNTLSVAEAIDIEVKLMAEDLGVENEEDIKGKFDMLFGTNKSDISDLKHGSTNHPFNPDRSAKRNFIPTPEFSTIIDNLIGGFEKKGYFLNDLEDNKKKQFYSTVKFLKTLNYMEFTDGYYYKERGGDLKVVNLHPIDMSEKEWNKLSKKEQEKVIKDVSWRNALEYIYNTLFSKITGEKEEEERKNTPEEDNEIKNHIKNIVSKYKTIIMDHYKVDEKTLNRAVNNISKLKSVTNTDFKQEKLPFDYNYTSEKNKEDVINSIPIVTPSEKKVKKLETRNIKHNQMLGEDYQERLPDPERTSEDLERTLQNKLDKMFSYNVSDFTSMTLLKMEIKNQLLPETHPVKIGKIKKEIELINFKEFPNAILEEEDLGRWARNYEFASLSGESLKSAIRKVVFGGKSKIGNDKQTPNPTEKPEIGNDKQTPNPTEKPEIGNDKQTPNPTEKPKRLEDLLKELVPSGTKIRDFDMDMLETAYGGRVLRDYPDIDHVTGEPKLKKNGEPRMINDLTNAIRSINSLVNSYITQTKSTKNQDEEDEEYYKSLGLGTIEV